MQKVKNNSGFTLLEEHPNTTVSKFADSGYALTQYPSYAMAQANPSNIWFASYDIPVNRITYNQNEGDQAFANILNVPDYYSQITTFEEVKTGATLTSILECVGAGALVWTFNTRGYYHIIIIFRREVWQLRH